MIVRSERRDPTIDKIWNILDEVKDPEIPVISLKELGILRDVYHADETYRVVITPTYSGCPAMQQIEDDVIKALKKHDIEVVVHIRLAPAWTTDWMLDTGKEKLKAYGIAPPSCVQRDVNPLHFIREPFKADKVECPRCHSTETEVVSEFGSTACKAHYKCLSCEEPFDYFKPY